MTTIAQKNITTGAAAIVTGIGLLVMSGWYFHMPELARLLPGAIPARMNAGLCFLISGLILLLHHRNENSRLRKLFILTAPWFIILIGLLTVLEYMSGINLGIDTLLYTPGNGLPEIGRMSIPAAVKFIMMGCSFLLLPHRRYHLLIHISNILIILSSLLTLLDYVSSTVYFDDFLQFYTSSPLAAILFILLTAAIHYSKHLHYLQVSFKKKIAGFFTLAFLVLGFLFLALRKNNDEISVIARQVDKTDEVITINNILHTEVESMQNHLKNYLILNSEEMRRDYYQAASRISRMLDTLYAMTAGEDFVQLRIDTIRTILAGYSASRQEIISLHDIKNLDEKGLNTTIGGGKIIIDGVRERINAIATNKKLMLEKLRNEKYRHLQKSPWIIGLSQLFSATFLLLAFYMIYLNSRSRDHAESALNKSEKFLKAIINNSNNPIAIRDLKGRYMMVNGPLENMLHDTRENIRGKSLWELHPKQLADAAKTADDLVIESGQSLSQELTLQQDGSKQTYSVSRFPITDEQNNIYAVGTIATDITALRKAKELLEEYMHFFNNSNDICVIAGISGEFENVNPTTLSVLGYSAAEITGKSFIDFVHPDDILFMVREIEKSKASLNTSINFSRRFIKRDGDYIWINWKATTDTVTQKIYAVGRDITEEKKLELTLKQFNTELERLVEEKTRLVLEKEHQYRFLLENMREGIQIISYDWRYLFVNNSVVDQSQYAGEKELLGYTMMEKYPGIETTDLFRVLERCMYERSPETIENFFLFPNGEKGWFELSIQPVPEGIFILSIDITDRKRADEKLSNYTEELKRSNAELERFAYVASHDLQEPLRMVSSFMNLLNRRLDGQLDDTAKQYMHYAVDGADRMKTLIHDLLEYSRVGTHKENFVLIDPMEVMNYVTRVLDEDVQKTGAIISIQPMPSIMASKTLFSQLLVNLVSNALKYNGNKIPQIEVGCREDKSTVTFHVKDNGEGIDAKFFDKIFIIFQRLHNKGEYSGTGIGLAICKKIVEAHKGKIWVESEQGTGSTFYFIIPKLPYETGRS